MAEERVFEVSCHDVAMFWDFDSMQNGANAKRKDPDVRDGRQYRELAEVHDWRQNSQLELLVTIQGRFTSIQPTLRAQLIEAFKVSDRDNQRPHQRSRVAPSDREFE